MPDRPVPVTDLTGVPDPVLAGALATASAPEVSRTVHRTPDHDEPLPLPVKGRGRLNATAQPAFGGIMVRIEDDERDDFWAELHLSTGQLEELLRRARAAAP